jgi:membrane protein DedA with SNARE-associated domain
MREIAVHWITQHGYVGIFSLLVFGIVGLPVPDEWLLTFSGYLVFRRTLVFVPTLLAAFLGSACGITVSYSLGRIFDTYILEKYGWLLHLRPDTLSRVHSWFERRGRWTLLIGYFIPGVRHLTGYVAGVSELSFANFALFAYTGAFCWATIFITLGYFLGEQWNRVTNSLHQTTLLVSAIAVAGVLAYAGFVIYRRRLPRS